MLRAEGRTNPGMVRDNNEDSFCIDTDLSLFVVADGMGGQLAGEVASRMAVDVLRDSLRTAADSEAVMGAVDSRFSSAANRLASGIRLASRVIFEGAQTNPAWRKMGSTIVAALVSGSRLSIAHVGDSRIYLIRGGSLVHLTDDHSLVAEQVRRGLISAEEAETSSMRNVITRALGQESDVEVDLAEMELMDNDRILLCSDGLTTMVGDEDILRICVSEDDPGIVCDRLIAGANAAGGKDNVTVVLLKVSNGGFFAGIQKLFGRGR